jgi:hypothetical protein
MLHRNMKCILLIQLNFVNPHPNHKANCVASQQHPSGQTACRRRLGRRLPDHGES